MSQQGSVTWLHLSDLHLCEPKNGVDRYRLFRELKNDLQKMQREHQLEPDLLFVTGDLAWGHDEAKGYLLPEQYREVHGIIEEIRTANRRKEIPRKHVFLVPGNHDVDRTRVAKPLTFWLDNGAEGTDVEDMLSTAGYDWNLYMDRLHAYRSFLESNDYNHLLDDRKRLIYGSTVEINGLRIAIAGLNSAWSCVRPREEKVWAAGRQQLRLLWPKVEHAHMRIALIHHPCRWINSHEAADLDRDLTRDYDFALHGHEHQMFLETKQGHHHRVAAGATYQGTREENSYSIARINVASATGAVWMRKYETASEKWKPKTIEEYTDNHGMWSLGDSLTRLASRYHSERAANSEETVRQAAAVCVKVMDGAVHLLLIRTNQERWMFPKTLVDDESPSDAARRAASKEGGVSGTLEDPPFTCFDYVRKKDPAVRMAAYLLHVEEQRPAPKKRNPTWFPLAHGFEVLKENRVPPEWEPLVSVLEHASRRVRS